MKTKIIEIPSMRIVDVLDYMADDLVEVAMDAFGEGMTRMEVLDHIRPMDHLYIANHGKEVVGFATATVGKDHVFLEGAAVKEKAQGLGIYSQFTLRRMNAGLCKGKKEVQLRTQNPNVEVGVRSTLDFLVDARILESYEVDRGKIPGFYGRLLTDKPLESGIELIDEVYRKLDREAGDTYHIKIGMTKVDLIERGIQDYGHYI